MTHDLDNKRAWAPCFQVEGVKLPTGYYFGASAATGIQNQFKLPKNINNFNFQVICLMHMTLSL